MTGKEKKHSCAHTTTSQPSTLLRLAERGSEKKEIERRRPHGSTG
jgi:hypothetical protein